MNNGSFLDCVVEERHKGGSVGDRASAEVLYPFSIVPEMYELVLNRKYGIELRSLKNGRGSGFKGDLKNNVSFNGSGRYSVDEIDEKILKKYSSVPDYCSMHVGGYEELMNHVAIVHELSYNHYVFGKEENLKGQFPNYCCGYSAANLFLTLMEKGYPNAAYFYNSDQDHAYNGLPFSFEDGKTKGFIIVDPTSDQLFTNKNKAPRNNLFVVLGARWEYKTDWAHGTDLFPSPDDNSTFSNLHTLRNFPSSTLYEKRAVKDYFSKVFDNVVVVNINSL